MQSIEGVAWWQACFSNSDGHVPDISKCPEHLHSHSKVNLSATNDRLAQASTIMTGTPVNPVQVRGGKVRF